MPLTYSNDYVREPIKRQIAISTFLPGQHLDSQQDTRTTYRPPPRSPFAPIQRQSPSKAQKV